MNDLKHLPEEDFVVYRIAQTNTYTAISGKYLRFIRQCAVEFQGLANVPFDKKVKGILFSPLDHNSYTLNANGLEQEIPVNQLCFETGDVKMHVTGKREIYDPYHLSGDTQLPLR